MPVDNDTGGGTQYTITHPRPTQPQPGDIAAAVALGVAVAVQLYTIFGSQGEASAAQITALVTTVLGLLVLIVTIVQDSVSQNVTIDVPSDPAAWTSLKRQEKGGALPSGIVADEVILFRDPDTSSGTKIQAVGGGISTPTMTVHLVEVATKASAAKTQYSCTYT